MIRRGDANARKIFVNAIERGKTRIQARETGNLRISARPRASCSQDMTRERIYALAYALISSTVVACIGLCSPNLAKKQLPRAPSETKSSSVFNQTRIRKEARAGGENRSGETVRQLRLLFPAVLLCFFLGENFLDSTSLQILVLNKTFFPQKRNLLGIFLFSKDYNPLRLFVFLFI